MAANNRERARKWIYVALSLSTPLALLVGIVVIKSAAEVGPLLASEKNRPDAGSKSAEADHPPIK